MLFMTIGSKRRRVSYEEDSLSRNPPAERNNEGNIASANSNNEKGLLRFIQTPNWSDLNFTATQTDTEERPILENSADVVASPASFGSKTKERTAVGPTKTDHLKRKVASRSTSRFKGEEPATMPITSDEKNRCPWLSDSKASKSSDLPDPNQKYQQQHSSQSGLKNDPKWCRDFLERIEDAQDPDEKKRRKAMTLDQKEDDIIIRLANLYYCSQEIVRRWIASKDTVEQQKKCLKSYKDKLSSAEARNRGLETSVLSLKKKLASYEKEHTALNVKLDVSSAELNKCTQDVTELNMKVDSLSTTLQAMNEQFSTTEAAWTSEKDVLMSTVDSLTKQIKQLEGEKSAVADDRRWLIREGFKHVVNKLRASDELLKLVGEVNTRASHVGFQEGLKAGYHFLKTGVPMESTSCYDANARNKLVRATRDFEGASFPYLEKLAACADCDDPLELLKSVEPVASQASTT